ncbi:MAG: elongation factor P maturation arginine rhamnosyltransferase EarP [Burkholderiaceae bacterium]|jgi:uncharacterized repeat protein (TIGR03837 family)|nr:elongation factor P maturation arginine rhamnosyltransferase EarP [Burkholderiaceae bacterium]
MLERPATPSNPAPLWDIFCRVIDNHGDLGVCWRLARQLAGRGQQVRLWADNASALRWMAPGALDGAAAGVQVLPWTQPIAVRQLASLPRSDVWVEAFGCQLPPEFVAAGARSGHAAPPPPPVWINLEYLSAQSYVRRMHGLPSPVLHGPAAGWTKWFYYPGFTDDTGGLLRERDLLARQDAFDRQAWRAAHSASGAATMPEARWASLFCYEPAALPEWLAQLGAAPFTTRLLVTAGRAARASRLALRQQRRGGSNNSRTTAPASGAPLEITWLPHLPQTGYDPLLWACDLNFVRGEDSLTRALWAGQPLLWHIYPQHDRAHHAKLEAFLDWLDAPASLRQFHRAWNGMAAPDALPTQGGWPAPGQLALWRECVQAARARVLQQSDLCTRLLAFVREKSAPA